MRLRFVCVLCALMTIQLASAQEWNVELGYQYLYANQWDKAVQTYNFSRPFIATKQPLLAHGSYFGGQYYFASQKKIHAGLKLNHSYYRSMAENPGLTATLRLQLLELGYVLRYEAPDKSNKFYFDLALSAITSHMTRSVNEEGLMIDEQRLRAWGIGGKLDLVAGYNLSSQKRYTLSPFAGLGYVPYFWSPQTEAVINQTRTLSGKENTSMLTWKIGMRMRLTKNSVATE